MNGWSAEYRRWEGASTGVWRRRAVVAGCALRLCAAGLIARICLGLVLLLGVAMAAVFFVFGQFSAHDSQLMRWIEARASEQVSDLLQGSSSWAMLYPEIYVDGVYRAVFYFYTPYALFFTWLTATLFVHRLIAQDLASDAIVIYRSKALGSIDYLLGKFGAVSAILCGIWIAPVAIAWLFGNLLSPDWAFFRHSLPTLGRSLGVGLVAAISLSCLALGASSLARHSGAAVAYWALGWIALSIVGGVAGSAYPVLGYVSPPACVSALAAQAYDLAGLLREARETLPYFDALVSWATSGDVESAQAEADRAFAGGFWAPLTSLALYSAASLALVAWKARPV